MLDVAELTANAVVKTNVGNITKDELYEAMKEKVGEHVLQQLVIDKVLSKEHKVTEKELDKKVDELKAIYGDQFEMILMQNQIKDEEELRESMKFNLLLEKAALSEIKVTEEEVKEYYDR